MNERVKEIINTATSLKMGITLFDENGRLCVEEIKSVLLQTEKVEDEIEDNLIIRDSNDDSIYFEYDEGTLSMYVPNVLKEKIVFSVEYIFSEFDKINEGISDLVKQFNINRIATIKNAEDVLKIQGANFSENAKMSLYTCRNSLGEVLYQLQMDIMSIIDYVYNIPTGKMRLFKIKVANVLQKEKVAHISVMEYIKGVGIYAEISMKLGDIDAAERRVNDALVFLRGIDENKRKRIEGWNQEKDMFWIQQFTEYEEVLTNVKDIITSRKILKIETK